MNLVSNRVVQMAGRGRCYIYGSMHIKMAREEILRELLNKVDYVLLEGFNVGD
jgi:molybdopterin-guanine dinucleotide biosynthesis protein